MADLQKLVRLLSSDLDGNKTILYELMKVKGVGLMFANAVLSVLQIPKGARLGTLSKEQLQKIEEVILHPQKFNLPSWLFNRRKDFETGENLHLASTQLFITNQEDIKQMKKIKTYKGVRHIFGLPVRGQKTRSNFRKNKGKGKLGVSLAGKKASKV